MIWVLLVLGGIVLFVGILALSRASGRAASAARAQEETAARRRAKREASERLADATKADYVSGLLDWNHVTECRVERDPGLLMIARDGRTIRVIAHSTAGRFKIYAQHDLSKEDITDASLRIPRLTRLETWTDVKESTQYTNKSTLGRALIGGALLGPLGVIAGAASAAGPKVKTSTKLEYVQEEVPYDGKPELVLGLRSMDTPLLKIDLPSRKAAEEWLYRVMMFANTGVKPGVDG